MRSFRNWKYYLIILSLLIGILKAETPKMICYSIHPNEYLNDHAKDIARIYDGFFFTIGSWDSGVENVLGVDGKLPKDPKWKAMAKENLAALNEAGVTENLLAVHFGKNDAWPSPGTVLSDKFTEKMSKHFSAIAKAAKELGFRGISIDTEYPYPRYEVTNEIYKYEDYTAENLMNAAYKKGKAVMNSILDQFPEAVIFQLPGQLLTRPIDRKFVIGMLEAMADRDAPGGFHLGSEFTYGMHSTVTDVAAPRFESASIPLLVNEKTAVYWKEKCSVASGTWPLHMIETGGKNYPIRPWKEEIADLRLQMSILLKVTKRYIWSYSGQPVWYVHSAETEKYGLKKQKLKFDDVEIGDWHQILMDKPELKDPSLIRLTEVVKKYDEGDLNGEQLCDAFGTPGRWWVLGLLDNPLINSKFAASKAVLEPIDKYNTHFGKNNVVRWYAFDNYDPRGITNLEYIWDWQNTDSASTQFVSFLHSDADHEAYLHTGWDDGIIVYLGDEIVFDQRTYPKRGKGMLYKDRYIFEKRIPIKIKKGVTRLSVVSLNSHGRWIFSLRITDENDMPFNDIKFRLEETLSNK